MTIYDRIKQIADENNVQTLRELVLLVKEDCLLSTVSRAFCSYVESLPSLTVSLQNEYERLIKLNIKIRNYRNGTIRKC